MSPLHRFWFHARLALIVACGLPNVVFPSIVGTVIPFLLAMCQMTFIASLLWTLVQGYLWKRHAARMQSIPLKWEEKGTHL
ncbi:MAG: hypothetical protein WCD86_02130 [Ktedonobacteraceae bacterium]